MTKHEKEIISYWLQSTNVAKSAIVRWHGSVGRLLDVDVNRCTGTFQLGRIRHGIKLCDVERIGK